jgi:hypothetical protein
MWEAHGFRRFILGDRSELTAHRESSGIPTSPHKVRGEIWGARIGGKGNLKGHLLDVPTKLVVTRKLRSSGRFGPHTFPRCSCQFLGRQAAPSRSSDNCSRYFATCGPQRYETPASSCALPQSNATRATPVPGELAAPGEHSAQPTPPTYPVSLQQLHDPCSF